MSAVEPTITSVSVFIIMIILIAFIGVYLFYKYTEEKIKELFFLSIFHIAVAIVVLISMLEAYNYGVIYSILVNISYYSSAIFFSIFIHKTFYKEKKSPIYIFLALFTVIFIVSIISALLYVPNSPKDLYYMLEILTINIIVILMFFWYGYIAIKQYKELKTQDIQPWIKRRYQISSMTSFCFGTSGLVYIIFEIINWIPDELYIREINLLIIAILLIIFGIGSFIAWVMPKSLKKYFNRNFSIPSEEEMTEDEIMKQMMED
ncbi:MAG: hypothetical protein ACFFBP_21725 [Promethearchaeota archaeon]